MADAEGEELLAEITRQAEEERRSLAEETRRKVEGIRAEADAELRRLEAESARTLEALRALELERVRGQVRNAERRRLLEVRRAGLRAAFDGARERLEALRRSEGHPAALERLIGEALAAVGEPGELVVAEADEAPARAAVAHLGQDCPVRADGREPGTVVAVSRDGLRRIDNSLFTRLRNAERLLEPEVARLLFSGGETPVSREQR